MHGNTVTSHFDGSSEPVTIVGLTEQHGSIAIPAHARSFGQMTML